jgi:peptidyl-tRNA hydrolase, PTH1 family
MNRSGEAVARFMHYYKLPLSGLLVVHDEIDLPPGIVRLKRGGGDGGHNGLHDVIEKLGSKDFSRLRLGVGHPGHRDEVVNYVLKKPSATDQALLDLVIDKTLVELPLILSGQFERAMTVLHSQQP